MSPTRACNQGQRQPWCPTVHMYVCSLLDNKSPVLTRTAQVYDETGIPKTVVSDTDRKLALLPRLPNFTCWRPFVTLFSDKCLLQSIIFHDFYTLFPFLSFCRIHKKAQDIRGKMSPNLRRTTGSGQTNNYLSGTPRSKRHISVSLKHCTHAGMDGVIAY